MTRHAAIYDVTVTRIDEENVVYARHAPKRHGPRRVVEQPEIPLGTIWDLGYRPLIGDVIRISTDRRRVL